MTLFPPTKYRGVTETLNTPSRKQLAQASQKTTNKDKTQQGENKKSERTECKPEKVGLKTANAVTITTQILTVENPKASLENKGTQKVEEKALTEEKLRRKNAK